MLIVIIANIVIVFVLCYAIESLRQQANDRLYKHHVRLLLLEKKAEEERDT